MPIPVVKEVIPFFIGSLALFWLAAAVCLALRRRRAAGAAFLLGIVAAGYMLFFFRDPARQAPLDPAVVVAGADGRVMSVTAMPEPRFLQTNAVRISIFLSLFDVHVNRAPISGTVRFLGYFPGRRFFTFQEKSSAYNQHSKIFIEGPATRCLIHQIVGPVARRVVYWLHPDQALRTGDRIGMMKFGSRLDMYLPADDVTVTVKPGDRVRAGETVVAAIVPREGAAMPR